MVSTLAQTVSLDDDHRGSGRVLPPAFIWVDESAAVMFESLSHTNEAYDLTFQRRGDRIPMVIGQIAYDKKQCGWLITYVQRHQLPAGESILYPSPIDAGKYLYDEHLKAKRAAVKERLAA